MKLKKVLTTVLSLALVVALTVAGTLAYLTDRDSKVNVFTVGDVEITLNEDFEQGAELVPGVNIEKVPTITNTGDNDAWVWMTFAVPAALDNWNPGTEEGSYKNIIHWNPLGATTDGYVDDARVTKAIELGYLPQGTTAQEIIDAKTTWNVFNALVNGGNCYQEKINEIDYNVYVIPYNKALEPGETTLPSIYNVFLDAQVDIDPEGNWAKVVGGVVTPIKWNTEENGNPIIYVSAYAIQEDGFTSVEEAYAAYQAQWGENGTEYAEAPNVVKNVEELEEALQDGGTIILLEDISTDIVDVNSGTDTNIDLGSNTLSGIVNNNGEMAVVDGKINADYIENYGNATFTDVDMVAGTPGDYSNINLGGSVAEYNNVNIDSKGGGIAAVDGAEVIFNSGSVAVNTTNTSGRYNFYTAGAGSTITINGGEFSFSKTLNQKRAYIYAGADTTVYVNGGTFGPASTRSGYTAGILGPGNVIIKGGTFGFNPTTWVADGYEAVQDGTTWTVSAK